MGIDRLSEQFRLSQFLSNSENPSMSVHINRELLNKPATQSANSLSSRRSKYRSRNYKEGSLKNDQAERVWRGVALYFVPRPIELNQSHRKQVDQL